MKTVILAIFVVSIVVLMGCGSKYPISVRGDVGHSEDARDAIFESAVRNELHWLKSNRVVFVAIRTHTDSCLPPSAAFLARFDDLDYDFRAGSDNTGLPPFDGREIRLELKFIRWIDSMEAKVKLLKYFSDSSSSHVGTARWDDGEWTYHDPMEKHKKRAREQLEEYKKRRQST